MKTIMSAFFGTLTVTLIAASWAPAPATACESADCTPSGLKCKFGSECCSKICKANYTCK